MLNGPKLSDADSTQLAAWRRERAGHFCLYHARMLQEVTVQTGCPWKPKLGIKGHAVRHSSRQLRMSAEKSNCVTPVGQAPLESENDVAIGMQRSGKPHLTSVSIRVLATSRILLSSRLPK
jgi:hypothetical protein